MQDRKIWDPLVRVFHWSVVAGFTANAFFTRPDGWLHQRIGYAILGFLMVRILWGFIGPTHARFSDFPPSPVAALGQAREMVTGKKHIHAGHSPLGALMIYNLLLVLLAIIGTGWMMTTTRWFGIAWVERLHSAAVVWAEVSALVHIAAVMVESLRLGVNLPKSMLTGYKNLPDKPSKGSTKRK